MYYRKSTIPPQAKLVFKGQIFDVYQWEQEMFDGSKAIFEKLKRPDTVQVIAITEDKKIIVQEEEQPGDPPFVTLPGGRIEENEPILDAAKRELLEETGYTSNSLSIYKEFKPSSKIDWVIYHLIAKNCKKISKPKLESGEKIKLDLLNFEEFVSIADEKNFRDTYIRNLIHELKLQPNGLENLQKALGL